MRPEDRVPHILCELKLPDRYERLAEFLGHEVANLLVAPPPEALNSIESLALEIRTRGEGVMVPLYGRSGAGKTTFVMNIAHWQPDAFAPTYLYEQSVEYAALQSALSDYEGTLPADNQRIIPINIDHRESNPPNDQELAVIKRFLRTNALRVPCMVFWPETNRATAASVSKSKYSVDPEAAPADLGA